MLLPPSSGTDRAQGLAARLGCTVAEHCEPYGKSKPAVLGSLSGLALTLKEFGGRWDRVERVYVFANWPMLEAALEYCVRNKDEARALGEMPKGLAWRRPSSSVDWSRRDTSTR